MKIAWKHLCVVTVIFLKSFRFERKIEKDLHSRITERKLNVSYEITFQTPMPIFFFHFTLFFLSFFSPLNFPFRKPQVFPHWRRSDPSLNGKGIVLLTAVTHFPRGTRRGNPEVDPHLLKECVKKQSPDSTI